MFIYYLLHELFELMSVRELAVVLELSEFMAFQKQPMFMNKVRVHEQNTFMNRTRACTCMKIPFVIQEYSLTVNGHFHERSWTLIVFCSRTFMIYPWIFMNFSPGLDYCRIHLFIFKNDGRAQCGTYLDYIGELKSLHMTVNVWSMWAKCPHTQGHYGSK